MIWDYVRKVKIGDEIIYIKDMHDKVICTQTNKIEFCNNDKSNCETLSIVEVLKYAR